jgi:hypothetical protein
MSIGKSGRIVMEVPADKKRLLYSELSKNGLSLKDWFLDRVNDYLRGALDPKISHPRDETTQNLAKQVNLKSPNKVSASKNLKSSASNLIKTYESLEKRYSVRVLKSDVSYVSPVNFVESLRRPRHRWFPYKEGFSPTFVRGFVSEFQTKSKGLLIDPFSGVGTTGLVAGSMGLKSIGFDVSPMAVFISRVKATTLNKSDLSKLLDFINSLRYTKISKQWAVPDNKTVVSYFDQNYLDALLSIRWIASQAPNEKIRDLALLAYLTLIEEFSTHRKAGNGVKKKTRIDYQSIELSPFEQVRNAFIHKLTEMNEDLRLEPLITQPIFHQASCIDAHKISNIEEISLALTSPPYANCFDYSKIYMRELWLGDFFKSSEDQKVFRKDSIRSHVHATWADRHIEHGSEIAEQLIKPILSSKELWSEKIPTMITGYFKDVGSLLSTLHPKFARGASFGIVVGNSVYGGVPIATDLLIAEMGEKIGYSISRIDVYRGVIPSSQQYNIIDDHRWARESTVILKKK